MLLRHDVLAGIETGRIGSVYRRWDRARVRAGSNLRTAIGVIEVVSIEVVDPEGLRRADAVEAGFESVPDLVASAGSRGETLYRIRLRHVGPDPRVILRETIPDDAGMNEIDRRLQRLDSISKHGSWTRDTLVLIAENPGVRAEDLAASVGREKMPFKLDVRKLKEIGLTESLLTGYRLSPRGEAVVKYLA
ncbi:MAG: hypothetical protein ACRDXF_05050 [Acidimicrobiia bacterium]